MFRRAFRRTLELKRVKVAAGPSNVGSNWAGGTGVINTVPYLDEGSGSDRRVGRKIFVRSFRLRAELAANPSLSTYTNVRLLVHKATTGKTPTVDSDTFGFVNQDYSVLSTRDQHQQGRILRDITWRLGYEAAGGSATPSIKVIDLWIPINSTVYYEGSSAASYVKNQISLLWVSDQAVAMPTVTYTYETTFTDA